MKQVTLITDGACVRPCGPGGWGAILRYKDHERELNGMEEVTTNNRMEMMGVIRGLEALKYPCRVHVISDSQYVIKGSKSWMPGWKSRGWRRAKGEIANLDLWKRLDTALSIHEVTWEWVKGHSGHVDNERADTLASMAIRDAQSRRQKRYER